MNHTTNRIQVMALLSAAVLAVTIASPATSQERMRAGLWEMTTTRDGATINSGTHCVTAEELAGSNGDARTIRAAVEKSFAKASCTVKDFAVAGKTVSLTVDCGSGENSHTIVSVGEYRGDTMEGSFTLKRGTSTQTMLTKGHRVGACT